MATIIHETEHEISRSTACNGAQLLDIRYYSSIAPLGRASRPKDIPWLIQSQSRSDVEKRFVEKRFEAIGFEVITEGTLNSSIVHPREVFHGAITVRAAGIVVAHNHSSGNPEPSNEDIEITHQLKEAGKILGIVLFDHLIITNDGLTSLAERGIL